MNQDKHEAQTEPAQAGSVDRLVGQSMTLDEVRSNTPALLLPYAETIYERMIAAEFSLGGVNLAEGKGNLVSPQTGDSEERIHPLGNQAGN